MSRRVLEGEQNDGGCVREGRVKRRSSARCGAVLQHFGVCGSSCRVPHLLVGVRSEVRVTSRPRVIRRTAECASVRPTARPGRGRMSRERGFLVEGSPRRIHGG